MTTLAQPDLRDSFIALELSPNYLVSKPIALLAQVETCMLNALQNAPRLHVTGSHTLEEAALYHLRCGGQRLRARLALDAAQAVGLTDHDSVHIAAAVELLHNASLIHDDLQDGDQFRRGREAVWSKFSKNLAICCGDFYLSTAYATLSQLSQHSALPKLFQRMHQGIAEAVFGQCADLTISADQLGLTTYIAIVMAKSGALLSLPLELVFMLNGRDHFVDLAKSACKDFAIGFQIIDDLRDVAGDISAAGRLSSGEQRLNIVSVFTRLQQTSPHAIDPVTAARDLALDHLQKAQSTSAILPAGSGHLLEECCLNLRSQLNELI